MQSPLRMSCLMLSVIGGRIGWLPMSRKTNVAVPTVPGGVVSLVQNGIMIVSPSSLNRVGPNVYPGGIWESNSKLP